MLRMIENADHELQGDIGQDETARLVDEAEPVLGLVDADDRDDPHGKIEGDQQSRQASPAPRGRTCTSA